MHSLTQPSGCSGEGWGREDRSIGFVQAKPSIVRFLLFLGNVKDMLSIDSNEQNLHCSLSN